MRVNLLKLLLLTCAILPGFANPPEGVTEEEWQTILRMRERQKQRPQQGKEVQIAGGDIRDGVAKGNAFTLGQGGALPTYNPEKPKLPHSKDMHIAGGDIRHDGAARENTLTLANAGVQPAFAHKPSDPATVTPPPVPAFPPRLKTRVAEKDPGSIPSYPSIPSTSYPSQEYQYAPTPYSWPAYQETPPPSYPDFQESYQEPMFQQQILQRQVAFPAEPVLEGFSYGDIQKYFGVSNLQTLLQAEKINFGWKNYGPSDFKKIFSILIEAAKQGNFVNLKELSVASNMIGDSINLLIYLFRISRFENLEILHLNNNKMSAEDIIKISNALVDAIKEGRLPNLKEVSIRGGNSVYGNYSALQEKLNVALGSLKTALEYRGGGIN